MIGEYLAIGFDVWRYSLGVAFIITGIVKSRDMEGFVTSIHS